MRAGHVGSGPCALLPVASMPFVSGLSALRGSGAHGALCDAGSLVRLFERRAPGVEWLLCPPGPSAGQGCAISLT